MKIPATPTCCKQFDTDQGRIKEGVLYSSPTFEVVSKPLPNGVYGETYINEFPFKVHINSNQPKSRAQLGLVHETVHVAEKLLKLNMSHDQVHSLAAFLVTEVLPSVAAFERSNPNSK